MTISQPSRSAPVTVSVTGRLLHTPKVGWALLIAAAGVIFAVLVCRAAVGMRALTVHGVEFDPSGLVVTESIHPQVNPGDRLVAVDGVRAYRERLTALYGEIPVGDVAPLTFERNGEPITVEVASRPLSDLHEIALWVRVTSTVACFLIGLISFALLPGSRAAWLFLLFCTNLELTLGFNILFARSPEAFLRLEPLTFGIGGSVGLHLFTEMPERLRLISRKPWAAALLYLPAVPIVFLALTNPTESTVWLWLALAGGSWSIVSGVFSLSILIRGTRHADRKGDEPLASRYRTLLVAVLVGLFLPAIIHTARGITGLGHERWVVHLNAAPVVAYALITGYALLRQNVLGADRVTTTVVSYAATLLLLAFACGVVLLTVVLLFGERVVASPTALVVVTALASLSIVPVYRWLKQTVDRRFLRDRASDERITAELRDLLKLAMLGDPSKTMEAAFSALKVLAPERVELWLREENGDEFHPRRVEPRPAAPEDRSPVPTSSALGQAMLAEKTGGVEGLVPTTLSPEAQADLWDRGLAVAAPVSVQSEVRAFVGLGRRSSGSRFAAGELSFLSMVASQIGLALERGQEGTSIGRYRLDRRLGTGGMAEVYLARQIGMAGFERKVAIKRPLPHLIDDAGYVAMLLDEARLAAQLSHPNIVQTYEVDRQGGTYYIAMEYVDGWSLRSLLRAARGAGEGPSVAVTARIASSLLSALAYAHEAVDGRGRKLGIIHRDVTPGNVLIGRDGTIKLVDFGVARSAARLQVTQTGVIKGTLAYMAPEQASGGHVDVRSDVFAAAAVIYECLMAAPPYPDGPPTSPPPSPPPIRFDVPAPVATVVQTALEFDPADRYASAEDMRQAFLTACRPLEVAPPEQVSAWMKEVMDRAPPMDNLAFQEAATVTVRPRGP